ncbi:hypothetical protein IMZ48_40145 [Candidatus Bathyarchaeota archaeon]|nr:hypothetical protein [Candidatus Bathyarchaeota archaeon]
MGSPGPLRPSTGSASDADPSIRRGPWSPPEDETLLQLVDLHGPSNWVLIAHSLRTRSAKQCRERYHQNLKPSLDHTPIRPAEAEAIERLVTELGHRWAEIARRLPGRSDNTIKNWWNGKQNKISRNEHLKTAYGGRYAAGSPVAGGHYDYAGVHRTPQTPPHDDRFHAASPSRRHHPGPGSPEYTHRYDGAGFQNGYPPRDGAEMAPYPYGSHGGPALRGSPAGRALELPPITGGPREARPRTPAETTHPHRPNQLPGIHTVLPPSPGGGGGDERHRRARSSRMALDTLISR